MKSVAKLCFWVVLFWLSYAPVASAQTASTDPAAVRVREEQFSRKWAEFSAKTDAVPYVKTKGKHKAALEAEYNDLIDEIDNLFHNKAVQAAAPSKPVLSEKSSRLNNSAGVIN